MGVLKGRSVAACLAALLMAGECRAVESNSPSAAYSEDEIKSAMLYNFTRFIEWPAGALGAEGAPLVVCTIGDPALAPALESALRNKTAYGHPLMLRRLAAGASPKGCAVLFIGLSGRKQVDNILQSAGRLATLTIGEHDQFTRQGGVIAFTREGNRIRFEINLDAAERAGLRISSKLLRLAAVWRESCPQARN